MTNHLPAVRRLSEEPRALSALLAAAVGRAAAAGVKNARACLAHDPSTEAALATLLGPEQTEREAESLMARPLDPGVSWADLEALFGGPGAYFWPLDDF